MPKRVAILQSNYIPWKGYFDLVNLVDEFILFDDRQYTRRDWRNRNLIKTPSGVRWLTIPVQVRGFEMAIDEVPVGDPTWATRHWNAIEGNYRQAECFDAMAPFLRSLYDEAAGLPMLSQVNRLFLAAIARRLGIHTSITSSRDHRAAGSRTDRLVSLCRQVGAGLYLSGPSARAYIEEEKFQSAGIELVYMDYSGYAEYPQVHPPFQHQVSIVDLLLNTGSAARSFLKS